MEHEEHEPKQGNLDPSPPFPPPDPGQPCVEEPKPEPSEQPNDDKAKSQCGGCAADAR